MVLAQYAETYPVKEEVDEDDVAAVVGRWTGIPVDRLLESETQKLIHLEERLHERVVGQDEAVEAVSNQLFLWLQGEQRTITVFPLSASSRIFSPIVSNVSVYESESS